MLPISIFSEAITTQIEKNYFVKQPPVRNTRSGGDWAKTRVTSDIEDLKKQLHQLRNEVNQLRERR